MVGDPGGIPRDREGFGPREGAGKVGGWEWGARPKKGKIWPEKALNPALK